MNEPNNQGNGEDVSGKESSRSGTGPSITSNDLAGILSNIGISAPTPDVLNPNIGAIKTVKNLPSKADKRKKKVKKIVKSRPRLRKPPPTFANFGLVDLNEDRKDLKLSKSRVKAKSLLQKIPGISEKTKSNPNRRRKLLRVIKKKKQLGLNVVNVESFLQTKRSLSDTSDVCTTMKSSSNVNYAITKITETIT